MKIVEYAKEIKRIIKNHKTVFITGHKELDIDAIGSSLGIYSIVKNYNRQAYIIVDDEKLEAGVLKVIANQVDIKFIKSSEIEALKTNTNLLIVVDTNKINLLPNENLINEFTDIIVIDHHQTNEKTIKNGLIVIDESKSSTCEMITELINNYKVPIHSEIATSLLSGIVLDTNNFTLTTTKDTYYSAYLLTKQGANPKKARSYLKQDINAYIMQQQAITNVEVINDKYAITVCSDKIIYKREELARIADTLMEFNGIEASFVLGKIDKDIIGLSARSEEDINVGKVAEKFGGGGSSNEAAAKINSNNLTKEKQNLMNIIRKER